MKTRKMTIFGIMLIAVICLVGCTKPEDNNGNNNGGDNGSNSTSTGAINGKFTINANGDKVFFSQGNLQYQASTNTWQFATNQYDFIGRANHNISQTYSGWIDLFGWGTSGWNSGARCYQPWSSSNSSSDYYPGGNYTNNLTGSYANADWGIYNPISNGGNQAGIWRTLSRKEWVFLLKTRYTSSGIRFAMAQVNGMNGVILVPDDWNMTTFSLNNTNEGSEGFTSNVVSEMVWQNTFEPAGAVFLPAAGGREGTSVAYVGSDGYYWSSSYYDSRGAYFVSFDDRHFSPDHGGNRRGYGYSVRLVRSCPM